MATSVRSRAGNLPSELTTFIGRRRELAEVKRLLCSSRLVTLTGIGGVGKTRLALRVGEAVRRDVVDGVWFVELAELHEPELVSDTVAAVFGLHDQAARSPLDLLVEHFADRDALLILDNCEHLVAAAAELMSALLRECPRVRVLATSMEPLGIGGETILRVQPLPVPDPDAPPALDALPRYEAVTLFVDRARSAQPDFVVSEENRVAIARICHRLDGLPLPIELAAARVRALSPEQILERLNDRFRLLTAGSRVAPTRQQTLRCSVDWSYELCTPQERRLWARLAVFSGGFELDAAEGICVEDAAPGEVVDLVGSLVDKSILLAEGAGPVVRYGMFETLRDYGLEKLEEAGEYVRCRRLHRDWFRGFAERAVADWIGPRQPEVIARLDREQANLRDALEFCISDPGEGDAGVHMAAAVFPFWFCRGMFGEGRRWLTRALDESEDRPDRVRVAAVCAASQLAGMQDDFSAAADLIAHAAHLAERIGDPLVDAMVAHACGLHAMYRRDLERATDNFERAVGPFREASDPHWLICVLQGLGLVSGMRGDLARAKACHAEVVAITAARGECEFRARAMVMLGVALWSQGDHVRASGLFDEALQLAGRVDDHFGGAGCLESMAWCAAAHRDGERAAILSGAAEALRQAMGVSVALIPTMVVHHEECRRQCRRILGDRAFEAAFANGAAFEFSEAVDYVRGRRNGFDLPRAEMDAPTAPMRIVTPPPETPALTRRERQVADLVARGLTNRAIAETLVISPRTAEGHVERVLAKLGYGSRAQIAAWVAEHDRA